jgi:hypothetical protein
MPGSIQVDAPRAPCTPKILTPGAVLQVGEEEGCLGVARLESVRCLADEVLMGKTCSLVVLLLLGAGTAGTADTPGERESLRGLRLKAISVRVENPGPEAESDGITKSQLQTDVELRLRQSGILVADTSKVGDVYVNVNALKRDGGIGYVYSVVVQFDQPVTVSRTGNSVIAATWTLPPTVVFVSLPRASPAIREAVRDLVDKFINAFLSVNPKP